MTRQELVTVRKLFEVLDVASFNGLNAKKINEIAMKCQQAAVALNNIDKRLLEQEAKDNAVK